MTLLILACVVGGVFYMTNPRRLAGMAQILLSDALDGHVTVKSAHLSLSGILQLSGVRLVTHVGKVKTELFSADAVRVHFKWLGLISGKLAASRIRAIHPVLNLVDDTDVGRWNYQAFLRHPGPSASHFPAVTPPTRSVRRPPAPPSSMSLIHLPAITLTGAVVRWGVIRKGKYSLAGESVIDGVLRPLHHSDVLYAISIHQRSVYGRPALNLRGSWNIATRTFQANVRRLKLSEAFRRSLPPAMQRLWKHLGLRGQISQLHLAIGPLSPMQVSAALDDVSLAIPYKSRRLGVVPVNIRHLTGEVQFKGQSLAIENLKGIALGWHFAVPRAHFQGFGHGNRFNVTVKMPNLLLPNRFPAIFRTSNFSIADGIFYRLRPRGLLNMTVHVTRTLRNGDVHVAGTIECKDLSARYVHFPYPLHNVQGLIRFTSHHIHFVHVHAIAETFPVTLNGLVSINEAGGPISLQISSPRGYFDKRLAACLPKDIKPIWNKFTPVGYGAFQADVTRPAGENSSPKIVLHIFPQDVTGYYHDFPYVMHHVHGEIYFSDRITKIINLTAPVGKHGSITFTGDVDYRSGSLASMQPHVHLVAKHLPVNAELLYSLPRSFEHALATFRVKSGYVDADAMITRGTHGSPAVNGVLRLFGAQLHPKLLPWPITNVSAKVLLTPNHFLVQSILGQIAGNKASSVKASVAVRDSRHQPVRVSAHGVWSGLLITPHPPSQIKGAYAKMWKKFRPAGNLAGGFQLAISIPHHGQESLWKDVKTLAVQLRPNDMTLYPRTFPAAVEKVTGLIGIANGKVKIKSLTAKAGPISLTTSGDFIPSTGTLKLEALAEAPRVSKRWLGLLPAAPRRLVAQLHPAGSFELYFTDLERRIEKSGPGWKFVGSLALRHFTLDHTLKAVIGSGVVTIAGDLDAHETVPNLAGEFHLRHVLIAGHKVRALMGEVTGNRLTKTINIHHLSGNVASGVLSGNVMLHFKPKVSISADFNLANAQLADLLQTEPMTPTKPVSGTPATQTAPKATKERHTSTGLVNAKLHFAQLLGKLSSTSGYGDLIITKANIYNVPLSMGLLQIATLRLPVSSAFNRAKIYYTIRGNSVEFRKIRLHSPGVDLLGQGRMDLTNQQVDLELITQSPSGTSIPLLGLFVGLARSQLLQLHVHGPISHPHITPIPLRILAFPFGEP